MTTSWSSNLVVTLLCCLALHTPLCHAQDSGFEEHLISTGSVGAFKSLHYIDLNGDGIDDLVAPDGLWFRGLGQNETSFVRDSYINTLKPITVKPVDLDWDGDIDLVGDIHDSEIRLYWFENDGEATPSFEYHRIGTLKDVGIGISEYGVYDIATSIGGIFWANSMWTGVDPDMNYFSYLPLTGEIDFLPVEAIALGNIDGDQRTDIVLAGSDSIGLLYGGAPPYYSYKSVFHKYYGVYLRLADVDFDFDLDVLAGDQDYFYWFENDGNGDFTPHYIDALTEGAHDSVLDGAGAEADFDGDGDLDLLVYRDPLGLFWYENLLEDGSDPLVFVRHHIVNRDWYGVTTADADADGDMDIYAAGRDGLYYFENRINETGLPAITPTPMATATPLPTPTPAPLTKSMVDLNKDGRVDKDDLLLMQRFWHE